MAQRAPDWLLNMAAESPELVEDSPSYRQDEAAQLKRNLRQTAETAFDAVAARREAQMAERRAQERAMQSPPSPTPEETRTGTPRDAGPYEPPERYTGIEDYQPANASIRPPSPIGPPLSAPDVVTPAILAQREMLPMPDDSPENDDIVGNPEAEVGLAAELSGMAPEDVATLAMLGAWGRRKEDEEYAAGLPVGRASIAHSDSHPAGRPSPPPTGATRPMVPAPLGGDTINAEPPMTAGGGYMPSEQGLIAPQDIPLLSGPPPEASPLPPEQAPA